MPSSAEYIKRLRRSVREIEIENRRSEKIIENLVQKRQTQIDNDSKIDLKDEILATWLTDYESDVKILFSQNRNTGRGDDSGYVVGDVMNEMRKRVSEAGDQKSEIDFRSIIDLLDDDASNLGLLCGELLKKFRLGQVVDEIEKQRLRRRDDSIEVEGGDNSKIDRQTGEIAEIDIPKIGEGETKAAVEQEASDDNNSQNQIDQSKSGGVEPSEKIDSGEQENQNQNENQKGDDDQAEDLSQYENYFRFTIVDEKNRPLGVPVPTEPTPPDQGENVSLPPSLIDDQQQSIPVVDFKIEQPDVRMLYEEGDDDWCTPVCSSGSSVCEEPTQSDGRDLWREVAMAIVEQNRLNQDGGGIPLDQLHQIVSMYVPANSGNEIEIEVDVRVQVEYEVD